MTDKAELPKIPCPLCDSCDHDIRTGLLELMANMKDNFTHAGTKILDGIEASDLETSTEHFAQALIEMQIVASQIYALQELVPDLHGIKVRSL